MSIPFLDGFLQWLHVIAAVLAVGGVFFMRFILCPALKKLPPDQEPAKKQILHGVSRGFKIVIHSSIAVLLLTGLYRYIHTLDQTKGWKEYQMLFGIKFLFAMVLFVVAIMLTLPSQQPNYFQRNRDKWLWVNFVLGALIILLSATLRRMWDAH